MRFRDLAVMAAAWAAGLATLAGGRRAVEAAVAENAGRADADVYVRRVVELKDLAAYMPDLRIDPEPGNAASGEWRVARGVITGTFSRPMSAPDGRRVSPTGRPLRVGMATIGHWKNGMLDRQWLFWDEREFARQLGLRR